MQKILMADVLAAVELKTRLDEVNEVIHRIEEGDTFDNPKDIEYKTMYTARGGYKVSACLSRENFMTALKAEQTVILLKIAELGVEL